MVLQQQTTITAELGKQEIIIARTFDAPRELMFRAFTAPHLIPEWWGPRQLSTELDKMDVRTGGQCAGSIEMLRETPTHFTVCIMKSWRQNALFIPLNLKGYRKQAM